MIGVKLPKQNLMRVEFSCGEGDKSTYAIGGRIALLQVIQPKMVKDVLGNGFPENERYVRVVIEYNEDGYAILRKEYGSSEWNWAYSCMTAEVMLSQKHPGKNGYIRLYNNRLAVEMHPVLGHSRDYDEKEGIMQNLGCAPLALSLLLWWNPGRYQWTQEKLFLVIESHDMCPVTNNMRIKILKGLLTLGVIKMEMNAQGEACFVCSFPGKKEDFEKLFGLALPPVNFEYVSDFIDE